jgi:hypothetical protein
MSTGMSASQSYKLSNATGFDIYAVSGVDQAVLQVTPSGPIQNAVLTTPNAALGGGNTLSWNSLQGDEISVLPDETIYFGCSSGCAGTGETRRLNLSNLSPTGVEFQYLSYGPWASDVVTNLLNPALTAVTGVAGYLVVGQPTQPLDIPVMGSASFVGLSEGFIANPVTESRATFLALLNASADFSARTISISTSQTQIDRLDGHGQQAGNVYDYSGTLTYLPGSNHLSGTVTTAGGPATLSGNATAQFFGPAAQELGGVIKLNDGAGVESMIGTFVGKQ